MVIPSVCRVILEDQYNENQQKLILTYIISLNILQYSIGNVIMSYNRQYHYDLKGYVSEVKGTKPTSDIMTFNGNIFGQ